MPGAEQGREGRSFGGGASGGELIKFNQIY